MNDFIQKMVDSIPTNLYIIAFAGIAVIVFVFSLIFCHAIKRHFDKSNNDPLKVWSYRVTDVLYTLFITLISIFPFLGMFGTVVALITLDMTEESLALQQNFFDALTSTAWGIIFAVFFKLLNAFFESYIEAQLSKAEKFLNL